MNSSQKTTCSHSKTYKLLISLPVYFVMLWFKHWLTSIIFFPSFLITYFMWLFLLLSICYWFKCKIAYFIMRVSIFLLKYVAKINVPLMNFLKVLYQSFKFSFFFCWFLTFLFLHFYLSFQISVFNHFKQIQS